jgi:hypothetical protein
MSDGAGRVESRWRVRFHRNSPSSFLLGASWSHHHEWPQRTTHLYLGPWLLTFVVSAPARLHSPDTTKKGGSG